MQHHRARRRPFSAVSRQYAYRAVLFHVSPGKWHIFAASLTSGAASKWRRAYTSSRRRAANIVNIHCDPSGLKPHTSFSEKIGLIPGGILSLIHLLAGFFPILFRRLIGRITNFLRDNDSMENHAHKTWYIVAGYPGTPVALTVAREEFPLLR